MATEINVEIETFEKMSNLVNERIEVGQFYLGASHLLVDVFRFLSDEKSFDDANRDGLNEILQLSESYLSASKSGIKEIGQVVEKFISICKTLSTLSSALELVRITGRIESARVNDEAEVSILLNRLKEFKVSIDQGLSQITFHNIRMNRISAELLDDL
jgi:hypothetical protein